MRTNVQMRELLGGAALPPDDGLPAGLQEIVDAGWTTGPGGSLLLDAARTGYWNSEIEPGDVAGYEYEVNDVHIPTDDLPAERDAFLRGAAHRGVEFARRALRKAADLPDPAGLTAVVRVVVEGDDPAGRATVRLFTLRGEHPDWFGDLEEFRQEALAVLDLAETPVI